MWSKKIVDKNDLKEIIKMNQRVDEFVEQLFLDNGYTIQKETKQNFNQKCELISLQVVNGNLSVNFAYFLDKNENISETLGKIKYFFDRRF